MEIKMTTTVYILTSLCAVKQGDYNYTFLKENLVALNQSVDHWALFGILNFHWNFLDYDLLDHFINEFSQKQHLLIKRRAVPRRRRAFAHGYDTEETALTDVEGQMDLYKEDIEEFKRTTTLKSFCEAVSEKECVYVDELPQSVRTIVLQHTHMDMKLSNVEEFRRRYVPYYNLRDCTMMMNSVITLPDDI